MPDSKPYLIPESKPSLKALELDPSLHSQEAAIWERINRFRACKADLDKNEGGLEKFADGHKIFGFNRDGNGITYREWLPNAKQVFLVGEFNDWDNSTPLKAEEFGRWSVHLPDRADGQPALPHRCQVKVRVETHDNEWIDRVPAWSQLAWQDHTTNLFNGVVWQPPAEERYTFKHERPQRPKSLKIYEAHVGMSSKEPKVATYLEFAEAILPRVKRLGYNAIQLMAVAEHAFYGSFGYHVTSYFAPSSRCGTPEELKRLVDEAHGMGISVIMDLVHAHCSSNSLDGIARMDGTDHCYTHGGIKGHHAQWDSKLFQYSKHEVMRFLLSNTKYWLEEFLFDGFRFDGVTSMLFHTHGIGRSFGGGYHEYFGLDADLEAQVYLMLANEVIHTIVPTAITVAEDVSGMPTLCLSIADGGFGFDYRLAMAIPDMLIKLMQQPDDLWDVGYICRTLTNRRWLEKCIAYAESHDQAIVGDKTLAFWLMDEEMYHGMSLAQNPEPSLSVDRGLALHKLIRLLVFGLGGEGYLNFMGNEFGHPEWIDFPRPENDWSYHLCRRRWDLPEDELLRYKFFEAFDELMQALENRFPWLCSDHQFVTVCNEEDKVLAFERGDCLFVVNFNPCQSFEAYKVGMTSEEPVRIVLDTDEARFGGQCRLETGHGRSFQPSGPTHNRPSSCMLYLPARTALVLVKSSLLDEGVRIWLSGEFLRFHRVGNPMELTVASEMQDEGGMKHLRHFRFGLDGCVKMRTCFDAKFVVLASNGSALCKCKTSADGVFRVHFPGDYTFVESGFLEAGKPQRPLDAASPGHADKETSLTLPQEAALDPSVDAGGMNHYPEPMMISSSSVSDLVTSSPQSKTAALASKTSKKAAPFQPPSRENTSAASARTVNYSPGSKKVSEQKSLESRLKSLRETASKLEHMRLLSESYRQFGLHLGNGGLWSYKEWVPEAQEVFLIGDFNGWDRQATPLTKHETIKDVWCCTIGMPFNAGLTKGSHYRLHVIPLEGEPIDVLPAWSRNYAHAPAEAGGALNAAVWFPTPSPSKPSQEAPGALGLGGPSHLFEFDLGLVSQPDSAPSFGEAAQILRRLSHMGYTGIVLKGFTAAGLLAPSACLGSSRDFAAFISGAHELDLCVYLSLSHHQSLGPDVLPGYFFKPMYGDESRSGTRVFDLSQMEVLRYLLSALTLWVEEYGVDGFRFEDTAGLIDEDLNCCKVSTGSDGKETTNPEASADEDAKTTKQQQGTSALHYLITCNMLLHSFTASSAAGVHKNTHATTNTTDGTSTSTATTTSPKSKHTLTTIADSNDYVAELCRPTEEGGLGFDICQREDTMDSLREFFSRGRLAEPKASARLPFRALVESLAQSCEARGKGSPVLVSAETLQECIAGRGPLRICMLAWETLHTVSGSAVAPHVTALSEALVHNRHSVHVFTRASHGKNIQKQTVNNVVYYEVPFAVHPDFVEETGNFCKALAAAVSEVEEQDGSFDIIHGHDWLVARAAQELQSRSKLFQRFVLSAHSTEQGRSGGAAFGGESSAVAALEAEAFKSADRLLAVSQTLNDEMCAQYGLDEKNVMLIRNGVDVDYLNESAATSIPFVRKELGLDSDFSGMMFLFLGRLLHQRGPDLLLEAVPFVLEHWSDARFVFAGAGPMKGALEKRAAELGVEHAVIFKATKSSGDASRALLQACDAVVLPGRQDAFGLSLLEAWAVGKPVIVTSCGEYRYLAQHDRDSMVVADESGSIAWGLCKLCENREHASWLGQQGQQRAREHLSWRRIVQQTEEVYFSLLDVLDLPSRRRYSQPLARALLRGPPKADEARGAALAPLKICRLLAFSFLGDATMACIGSDFGWHERVDRPRKGKSLNKLRSRIPHELADDKSLYYKYMVTFHMFLLRTERCLRWLSDPEPEVILEDQVASVMAFARGRCIFVFNLSQSDADFQLRLPKLPDDAELRPVLETNDHRFGGTATSAFCPGGLVQGALQLQLPASSAVVLALASDAAALAADATLQLGSADAFIDLVASPWLPAAVAPSPASVDDAKGSSPARLWTR